MQKKPRARLRYSGRSPCHRPVGKKTVSGGRRSLQAHGHRQVGHHFPPEPANLVIRGSVDVVQPRDLCCFNLCAALVKASCNLFLSTKQSNLPMDSYCTTCHRSWHPRARCRRTRRCNEPFPGSNHDAPPRPHQTPQAASTFWACWGARPSAFRAQLLPPVSEGARCPHCPVAPLSGTPFLDATLAHCAHPSLSHSLARRQICTHPLPPPPTSLANVQGSLRNTVPFS